MMDLEENELRSLDEVKRILGYAKVGDTELKYPVQCLSFTEDLDNEAVILLEMDHDVAKELHEGQQVVIRGVKTDSAVLCTSDKTFDMKDTETSNALLIMPECNIGAEVISDGDDFILQSRKVCALKHEYYELKSIKPRLQNMKRLLEENMYSGQECEDDDDHQGPKYTWRDLMDLIQASEVEINKGLVDLQACLIKDYWRMLDFDFVSKIMNDLILLREEQDWAFESIPAQQCCEQLEDIYPRNIVAHVLRCYSSLPNGESLHVDTHIAQQQTYKMNEDKVCQFFAELLLRPVDQFSLSDFCETWQQAVPEGMNTGLYQLEGVALVQRDTTPEVIRYFPVTSLPEDVGERFNKLFKTKTKWSLADITPYLRDLTTEKSNVSSFLTKYARASTLNGIKVYSSKRPLY